MGVFLSRLLCLNSTRSPWSSAAPRTVPGVPFVQGALAGPTPIVAEGLGQGTRSEGPLAECLGQRRGQQLVALRTACRPPAGHSGY